MKLGSAIEGLRITETNITDFDIEVDGVGDDSETIGENEIFVALCGSKYNGHRYIKDAINRGASVVVCEKKPKNSDIPYIRVKSTRIALSVIWNNFCARPSEKLKFIGVTGTNGKTSTVKMIEHILSSCGIKCESIGTLNAPLTTPDPNLLYPLLDECAQSGAEYAVMEVSSHSLYYDKLYPIEFDIGIFTNLTSEHLDFHDNMYDYAKAKAKLFSQSKICIYNANDKFAELVCKNCENRISYSLDCDECDFSAKECELSFERTKYLLLSHGELCKIELPLIGRFNIENSMAAFIAAKTLGIESERIKEALSDLPTVSGRLERVVSNGKIDVFIDYAHTPDAIEKVLRSLREIKSDNQRLVCVFGCGGDRDRQKRPKMGKIATELADYCIITSDNPRGEDPYAIIKDIADGTEKKNYLIIAERKRAIEYAIRCAKKDDVIVFAGKGHEKYEINSTGKIPFDEKALISEALDGD